MKRFAFAVFTAAALAAATVVPALAATPGSTFPEQPGNHVQTACATVISNPGTGSGGAAGLHESAIAETITSRLLADACG